MASDLQIQGEVSLSTADAERGLDSLGNKAGKMAVDMRQAGENAGKAVVKIGEIAQANGEKFTRSESAVVASIKRLALEAAKAQPVMDKLGNIEFNIAAKGLDSAKFKPMLDVVQQVSREAQAAATTITSAAIPSLDRMGLSAKQTAAALRGVPAQFTDIIMSLQGGQAPLTVFLQQGGQLKDMFGGAGNAARALGGYVLGLINPLTVTAAALGTIAVAYNQGSKENDAFVKSIALTGNASGVTVGQLRAYASAIDGVVGTQAQAAEGLAAFVNAGVRGGDELRRYTQTAIEWEKATGQAVSKTAEQFASLQNAPLAAVLKLNEGTNFLTTSVYDQIKSLAEQGRSADASRVAMDALDGAMRSRAQTIQESLGYIERGWNGIKGAAKEAWDAMLNVGRGTTDEQNLAQLRENLARQQERNSTLGIKEGQATADLKEQIRLLERKITLANDSASAQADEAKKTQSLIEWDKEGLKYLSDREKMQRELAKAQDEGVKAGKSQEQIESRLAAIRASYDKKTGGGGRVSSENKELAEQAKLIAELSGLTGSFAKDWDTLSAVYAKGGMSLDQLTQAQADLLAKQPAIKAATEEQAKAQQTLAKADLEAAQSREKYITSLATGLDKIQAEIATQEEATARMGLSKEAIAELDAAKLEMMATDLELQAIKAMDRNLDEQTYDALKQQAQAYRDLAKAKQAGAAKEVAVDAAKKAADEWQRTSDQVNQSLTDALMRGFESGKDFAQNLRDTVVNMFKTLVLRPIVKAIVSPVAGALTGALGLSTAAQAGQGASGVSTALSGASLMGSMGSLGAGLSYGAQSLFANGLGTTLTAGSQMLGAGSIMGGLGTIAGALGPIALGIGLLTSFIKKPTPHSGAGVTYSAAGGLTSGAGQYNKTNYGFGDTGEYSAESNTAVASVAKGIATALDSTAVAFGKKAGFEISTAFADDKSKDGAWGQLAIKLGGQTVLDWRDTQTSKWAPKEFSDGAAGLKEYQSAVAASMRDALSSLDLPGWVDSVLQDLGDAPALEDMEKALSSIALANDAMAALGSQIGGLSGLSDEATASLIEAFGGVESFATTASEYANVVLTDAEKVNLGMADISSQFEALGMSVPSSVAALQELIGAQDLTTDAGREAVASLMTLGTSFASVMDQMQQSIGLTGDSLKSVFQNVLKEANSAEEAKILGEQAAGQLLMDAISNALVGTVTDLVSNAVLQPITQSIVGAAAQAATMDVAAASAAGATLAAGGAAGATTIAAGSAAGATSLAAGGAAGGANVAAGGAAAGQGLAEIVGKAISVTNAMVDIMNNADFQTAFGAAVSAIGDISGTLFGGMTSIQTSMPGFGGGGSSAISGGGGGGSSATDNKNPLDDLLEERRQLEIELLKAQGQEQEALNRIRAKAIEGMSAEAVAAWDFNRALEKQIEQAQQVTDLKQEQHNLEIELLRAQGREEEAVAAVRADAIKGMTAEAVALYDANAALQEQIEQAVKLRDLEKEGANLQIELLKAQGRDEEALALIREEAIKGLSAQAVAQYDANQAVQEQIDILNERKGLERRLLEAQGDTAAIRQLELAATHEANRAILLRIWALEDEKKAAEAAQTAVDKAFDALKRAVQSAQEAAEKALKDAYEATEKTLKEQISAAEKIRSAASESLSSLEGIFDLLKEQIKDLRNEAGAGAPISEGNAYLDNLIASGAQPKQDELADAIESVRAGQKAERYGSAFEYNRDNLVLAGRLDTLKDKIGLQKTVAEQQLKAAEDSLVILNEQLETAKTQYEEELAKTKAYYEKVLENAQTQIDVLRGVDTSVLGVTAAVTALNAAVAAAAAQVVGAVHSISVDSTPLVSEVFPMPNLTYDDRTQDAWGKVVPVNFRAGGGYTPAGLTVVGEDGPELVNFAQPSMVYTSAQTSNLLGRGDSEVVVAELRSLREDNRAQAQALVRMQARLVTLMERWDGDGMPEERATA